MLTLRDYRFELGAFLQEVGEDFDVLRSWQRKPFFYKLIEKYKMFDKFGLQECHNLYLQYLKETENGISPLYRYQTNYSESKRIIDWYEHKRIAHFYQQLLNRGASISTAEQLTIERFEITHRIVQTATSSGYFAIYRPIVVGVLDA